MMISPWSERVKPMLSVLACGFLLAIFSGCAAMGYRLGSSLPPGINVVHVATLENRSGEPLLELEATQALIGELQREGTLSVGDADKADVVLVVVLETFSLEPLRYESDTSTSTSEYRMVIRAALELISRQSGNVLVRNNVRGETDFVLSGDLTSAKREAMPRVTADLAHQIVKSVVEFW